MHSATEANDRHRLIATLAKKYVWWLPPDEAARDERRVVAQVMDIGDFDDVRVAIERLGTEPFKVALTHAQAGWFSPKSWAYWHYRCGLTPYDSAPPPLPARPLGP